MPSAHDPIVAVPANGAVNGTTNGTNGDSHSRPHTPMTGMALTEYSVNPSTPSEEKRARIKEIVPDEYLLPTGYPDVSVVSRQ
jgi:threonine dehydratase